MGLKKVVFHCSLRSNTGQMVENRIVEIEKDVYRFKSLYTEKGIKDLVFSPKSLIKLGMVIKTRMRFSLSFMTVVVSFGSCQ